MIDWDVMSWLGMMTEFISWAAVGEVACPVFENPGALLWVPLYHLPGSAVEAVSELVNCRG